MNAFAGGRLERASASGGRLERASAGGGRPSAGLPRALASTSPSPGRPGSGGRSYALFQARVARRAFFWAKVAHRWRWRAWRSGAKSSLRMPLASLTTSLVAPSPSERLGSASRPLLGAERRSAVDTRGRLHERRHHNRVSFHPLGSRVFRIPRWGWRPPFLHLPLLGEVARPASFWAEVAHRTSKVACRARLGASARLPLTGEVARRTSDVARRVRLGARRPAYLLRAR